MVLYKNISEVYGEMFLERRVFAQPGSSLDLLHTDMLNLFTNSISRQILFGQWYGDRAPYYNTWGQMVELQAGGYTSCLPSDIGKMVTDDAANLGLLLDYDNTLRLWYVSTSTVVAAASTMAITAGTGAGTSHAANPSTAGLYRRTLELSPKPANLSSSTADVVKYDYQSYDIVGATDTAKILVLTKEFALGYNAKTKSTTIEGNCRCVTTVKCKGDGTRTVYIDSVKFYLYRETVGGARTLLGSEEYPGAGTGLVSTSVAAYTDPVTASAMFAIAAGTTLSTTDILVLKIEVYGHVSANNNVSDAIRLYFSRGTADTFVELPITYNKELI